LKVCIASTLGRAQGPDHTEAIVADSLVKHGFEVCIATNCRMDVLRHFSSNFDINLPKDTKVYGTLPSTLAYFPSFSPIWVSESLRKAIKKEKPDIVFSDGTPYHVSASEKTRITTAVYLSEPTVGALAHEHSAFGKQPLSAKIYSKLFSKIEDLITEKDVDIPIANSKAGALFYTPIYCKEVPVLFSPVDTSKFVPSEKENLVTHVGIINPRKRIEVAIEAVAAAKTKPKLSIIGNIIPSRGWYLNYLRSRVQQLGMDDRVTFHVNAPFNELQNVVSRSKVCVSAGVEYFSLAVIEQMAAGCVPIVSKSFVPWTEIVDKGKYGFGFDSVEELSSTIDRIISDDELYSKMQRLATGRAKEFDIKIFGDRLVDLLLRRKVS
jgi:glycosyltransferase involved in cell wall biosynthesis